MKIEDFDNFMFSAGMKAKYKGAVYSIATVNFEEKLLGLVEPELLDDVEDDDIFWVRCESAEVQS